MRKSIFPNKTPYYAFLLHLRARLLLLMIFLLPLLITHVYGNIVGLLHYHNFDFIHYSTFGKEYDMSSKTAKSHDNSEACDNW